MNMQVQRRPCPAEARRRSKTGLYRKGHACLDETLCIRRRIAHSKEMGFSFNNLLYNEQNVTAVALMNSEYRVRRERSYENDYVRSKATGARRN